MPKEGSEQAREPQGLQMLRQIYKLWEQTGSLLDGVMKFASEDIEWWAAGPPDILPWAGSFKGPDGVTDRFRVLNETVEYDRWEPFEHFAQEGTVVELIHAAGHVRATGRRCAGDICADLDVP